MEALKEFLEEVLSVKGWKLAVAGPIYEVLGNFDEKTQMAFEYAIIREEQRKVPLGIVCQGMRAVGIYLDAVGYDHMKSTLLEAAAVVRR